MIAPLISPLTPAEMAHRQARAAYDKAQARYIRHMNTAAKWRCCCEHGGLCTRARDLLDAADRAYVPREMAGGGR